MKQQHILELKSISELLDKQFFIPQYQRGFRWTNTQVEQLLDDIDQFFPREIANSNDKTFYCLQPIVVKLLSKVAEQQDLSGEWYEVIDGQQRLTTIHLILQYINDLWVGRKKLTQFKLNYETRKNCVNFISGIRVNDDNTTVDINNENIDFYYISNAYQTIRKWEISYQERKGKPLDEAEFQSKFLAHSKIIWYEVSEAQESRSLFERLNLGKIPLTNAELTKAIFLSSESFRELPGEERRLKQYEIARLWDDIEHQLNQADLRFWSFISNKKREQYETKIELILDLIAEKNDDRDPFQTFMTFTAKQKKGGLLNVWNEIEQFYFTISTWYMDKDYYHKIGYLVAAKHFGEFKGVRLDQLVKDSMNKTKHEFTLQIDDLIRKSVKVELSELRYETHYKQLFNVLLLFNVETVRTSKSISEFYPFKQHKDNVWSLEHIHARNSENFDRTKKEPWQKWLNLHKIILDEMVKEDSIIQESATLLNLIEEIVKWNNDQLTWERFNQLFLRINNVFTPQNEKMERDGEGLKNLALLSQPDNSALNNAVFEVKRREIIRLDKQGSFIPVCTKRVFMKYFNDDNTSEQNYYWSERDREQYYKTVSNTLKRYLPVNHIEPEPHEAQ